MIFNLCAVSDNNQINRREMTGLTCYFRHLNDVFKKAGIEVTTQNKQDIDKAIHKIVGVEYKNCPSAWKEVKTRLVQDQEAFVSALKKALGKR